MMSTKKAVRRPGRDARVMSHMPTRSTREVLTVQGHAGFAWRMALLKALYAVYAIAVP